MPNGIAELWSSRAAAWVALASAFAGVAAVTVFVDVSPRVEGEFFFAEDDPQMQASRDVAERFPAGDQLVLRVAARGGLDDAYGARIAALTADLLTVEGVESAYGIANQDAERSPLFARVLLTRDDDATNVVLEVGERDPELLLADVEEVVARHEGDDLDVIVSGVPAIVEMIRRSLERDLRVFSAAAVLVFALLIGAVYRDPAVVVGTLATCAVSVSVTLLGVRALGVPIGLLTANLVTIVFVLTLSHVVFLTASWSRATGAGLDRAQAVGRAVVETAEPSFWSMATTLLGFASLLVATARPLWELGVAGAVGTVVALIVAFAVYPAFLGSWARPVPWRAPADAVRRRVAPWGAVATVGVAVALLGLGILRLDTDPSLLSYFAPGSDIRVGLDEIDADGGTSTLDVVVRDPDGDPVDAPAVFRAMEALQESLEADPAVGVVLSPAVLIGHARTIPLAGFLPVRALLDIASSEQLGGVGLGFATPERDAARFQLRMRESLGEPRGEVIARVDSLVGAADLEPVAIAGLYDLQRQLGSLIASSLRIGIGGLLLLFLAVAGAVSRSARTALEMWVCLAAIPAVVLGAFGHLGIAVDIITSPSANIALAIGADSMIHLAVRARALGKDAGPDWTGALGQLAVPVLGAAAIVSAGFGIFVLSSFPPTRRFGLAVVLGTVAAATVALLVLPRLVERGKQAA